MNPLEVPLRAAAAAVLLVCAPASAREPGTDGGSGTAAKAEKPKAAPAAEGAGRCSGKATFCAVYSRFFCSSQPGCSFHYGSNLCGGIAVQCEKATNAAFCQKIKGCTWK